MLKLQVLDKDWQKRVQRKEKLPMGVEARDRQMNLARNYKRHKMRFKGIRVRMMTPKREKVCQN